MENQKGGDASKSNCKVKLMCSYGGKIQQRPHDHQLTYVGGETKILAVDRRIKFTDIVNKLISLSNSPDVISFKYQLPGEDLDALVSVINDDDLDHMMAEYDRIHTGSSLPKPTRLRIFLFCPTRSGSSRVPSSESLNPDFLFGFDKEYQYDYKTDSGKVRPDNSGLDPQNGAEIQAQIQGMNGLYQETLSREIHVTGGVYNTGGVGQMVYQIPVNAGGYQEQFGMGMQAVRMVPGIIYRDQPVYHYVPAMPSAMEQKMGFSADESKQMSGVRLEEGGVAANVAKDDGR